jgi:hypothetical protein
VGWRGVEGGVRGVWGGEEHPRRAGRWRSFPYLSVAGRRGSGGAGGGGGGGEGQTQTETGAGAGAGAETDTVTPTATATTTATDAAAPPTPLRPPPSTNPEVCDMARHLHQHTPVDTEFRDRLWTYLCDEWNRQHTPEERVERYHFYMLKADILPDMSYSAPVKRLIVSHYCT